MVKNASARKKKAVSSSKREEKSDFFYLQISPTKKERCPVAANHKMARFICLEKINLKIMYVSGSDLLI